MTSGTLMPAKVIENHLINTKQQLSIENVDIQEYSDGNQIDAHTPTCPEPRPTRYCTRLGNKKCDVIREGLRTCSN